MVSMSLMACSEPHFSEFLYPCRILYPVGGNEKDEYSDGKIEFRYFSNSLGLRILMVDEF